MVTISNGTRPDFYKRNVFVDFYFSQELSPFFPLVFRDVITIVKKIRPTWLLNVALIIKNGLTYFFFYFTSSLEKISGTIAF